MTIATALELSLESAQATALQLYLVVDGAQSEGSNIKLARQGIPFISLFDGTPEESLPEIAPLLVPLNDLPPVRRRELFDWAQEFAFSAPAISWITSQFEPQQCADHLRRFHVVGLGDGQGMLLRWYDTRILPIWLDCLTAEQHAAFTAGAVTWHAVDRTGVVSMLLDQPLPPEQPPAPRFGKRQITLDDRQYGLLVDASTLDGLLRQLRRVIPDELKRVPKNDLAAFVDSCLEIALAAGLKDLDRQTQVALLGLYTSGRGLEQSEFLRLLADPPSTLDGFYEAMQELPERVWEAGPPLWSSLPAATASRAS